MEGPGELIGSGRRADVYDLGGGRVLRRYRDGPRDVSAEAEVMVHVRSHGLPVPQVFDVSGRTDLVMEAVKGPTMLTDLASRPWRLRQGAEELARLHARVHAVPALERLRAPFGPGDRMLHLDLHPGNVILSEDGPVIIDWEGAGRGPPEADLAIAWLVIRFAEVPGPLHQQVIATVGQAAFAALFRRAAGPTDVAWVREGAAFRLRDSAAGPTEAVRLRRLVERASPA